MYCVSAGKKKKKLIVKIAAVLQSGVILERKSLR